MKKICVIGIGYVGLPTAAMFAEKGHTVVGYDLNQKAVDALNRGEIIIEEPKLPELVKECVASGKLSASTECPHHFDVYIIAVPTPINPDKTANMSYVKTVTEDIVPHLKSGTLIILESTSPPRTVEDLMLPILAKSGLKIGEELFVAHSPERILPGNVLEELRTNQRIVGGINEKSSLAVKELYETIVDAKIYMTTSTTAELCKVVENTFRDVNIAFANELAKISEELGVNVHEVIALANNHPRVNILSPGPGVGGHCIALDPWFLVEKSNHAKLIQNAREINDSMPQFVFEKIKAILGGFSGQTISIFGMTYKPNIDDVRESPLLHLLAYLKNENVVVKICEPHVKNDGAIENNFEIYEAVKDSSLCVLAVNHDEFIDIDFKKMAEQMTDKQILDTRNFWNKDIVEKSGIKYHLLGSNA